jgi:hypothetical protein
VVEKYCVADPIREVPGLLRYYRKVLTCIGVRLGVPLHLMQGLLESGVLTARPLRVGHVQAYYISDLLTGLVICFMVVFSPWAFGTTESWSIWTMNVCGYGLAILQLVKVVVQKSTAYRPRSWDGKPIEGASIRRERSQLCNDAGVYQRTKASGSRSFTWALAFCTCGILGFCLIAALNARAIYLPDSMIFEYYNYLPCLPSSFDRQSTLKGLWNYLGIACSFWAVWDWLRGPSPVDRAGDSLHGSAASHGGGVLPLPERLSRLLWVLAISGGLLGAEGIVQRLSGSYKLLFLVKPEIHQEAQEQFASYAYRANAGQYFNLLWPVCLGFWWVRSQLNGKCTRNSVPLLCAGVMAACPIISGARGAALVDSALLLVAIVGLMTCLLRRSAIARNKKWVAGTQLALFAAAALAVGIGLGWRQLGPRLGLVRSGLAERELLYGPARRAAADYPFFGTGPGTFERVFQFYRGSHEAYWPAQLHNDWLETRITWGWFGTGLVLVALFIVLMRWFLGGGITIDPGLTFLMWLSLLGCLVQARWDFPLQVYSILLLFVVWCAVLFTLSRTSVLEL